MAIQATEEIRSSVRPLHMSTQPAYALITDTHHLLLQEASSIVVVVFPST